MNNRLRQLVAQIITVVSMAPAISNASLGGIPGFSGSNVGTDSCHACHTQPASAPANTLSITGNNTVQAGAVNSYVLTLDAPYGQPVTGGGFDLSAASGFLIAPDSESIVVNSELVHSSRKTITDTGSGYRVQWNFDWQAPGAGGPAHLDACALPVDGDNTEGNDGITACTSLNVVIQEKPVANSGDDQDVFALAIVTLDGTGSYDPDGSISSYLWEQISGSPVLIANANTAVATFTAINLLAGTEQLVFRLTATDDNGLTDTDEVVVNVKALLFGDDAPQADAGVDQVVNENTFVNLDGTGSVDLLGSITSYFWEQTAGTYSVVLNNASTVSPSFTAPAVDINGDVLTFKLTVIDNVGLVASSTVDVTVNNVDISPVAVIADGSGAAISAAIANEAVTLYGNFSSDPDGPITAYSWSQTSGTAIVNPGPANQNSFTFTTPDTPGGSIGIQLVVTGDQGLVQNVVTTTLDLGDFPPVADAGLDQIVAEGDTVYLTGLVVDPNNNLASVEWRQINCEPDCIIGPVSIPLPLVAGIASTSFLAPSNVPAGGSATLDFELFAVDTGGLSSSSTMQLTINDNGADVGGQVFPDNTTSFINPDGLPMAISVASLDPQVSATITSLGFEDPATITDPDNRPQDFPYDLTDITVSLSAPGVIAITLYFPQPIPEGQDFYQYLESNGWINTTRARNFDDLEYDASGGWSEITGEAEFSVDRRSVTMLITDNGPGDQDPVANSIATIGGIGVNPASHEQQPGATGSINVLLLLCLVWMPGLLRSNRHH